MKVKQFGPGIFGNPFQIDFGPLHLFGNTKGLKHLYWWELCIGNNFCFHLFPKFLTTWLLINLTCKEKAGK